MQRSAKLAAQVLSVLAVLGYFTVSHAQTSGSQQPTAQAQSQPTGHKEMRHEQARDHLQWLSEQLNLTDDQKAKLKPILEDQAKQLKAVHDDTSLSQEQKRTKFREIHEATHSQVKAVLTAEQQKKFAELKEEAKEQHYGKKANPKESKPPNQ